MKAFKIVKMAVFDLKSAKFNFTEIVSDVKIMEFPHCASSIYHFKLDVDPSIASLEQTIRLVWLRLLMKLSGGSQTREMDRLSNTRQMQLTCYLMSFKVFFIFPNVRSCDKIGRLLDIYVLRQSMLFSRKYKMSNEAFDHFFRWEI